MLEGRVVFVTGASSGIGAACARAFSRQGARLVLAARRKERLDALAGELEAEGAPRPHVIGLDVRDPVSVEAAVRSLPPGRSSIDLLVNSAGLSRGLEALDEAAPSDWEEMIDTNVKGLLYVTRAVLPGMRDRGRGHIINIGSIAGREAYPGGNVYCATKAAVRLLTAGLRLDLVNTPIRVTSVDPGMVETEFGLVRFHGDGERAKKVYQGLTPLTGDDVAQAVVWAATRPEHVNVAEILLLPTDQASATVVHRRPRSG